jgi:hypothetical protein
MWSGVEWSEVWWDGATIYTICHIRKTRKSDHKSYIIFYHSIFNITYIFLHQSFFNMRFPNYPEVPWAQTWSIKFHLYFKSIVLSTSTHYNYWSFSLQYSAWIYPVLHYSHRAILITVLTPDSVFHTITTFYFLGFFHDSPFKLKY